METLLISASKIAGLGLDLFCRHWELSKLLSFRFFGFVVRKPWDHIGGPFRIST